MAQGSVKKRSTSASRDAPYKKRDHVGLVKASKKVDTKSTLQKKLSSDITRRIEAELAQKAMKEAPLRMISKDHVAAETKRIEQKKKQERKEKGRPNKKKS
jgi:hypothetical protein